MSLKVDHQKNKKPGTKPGFRNADFVLRFLMCQSSTVSVHVINKHNHVLCSRDKLSCLYGVHDTSIKLNMSRLMYLY